MSKEISPEDFVGMVFREELGFRVEKIPESDEPRPDFIMEKDGDKYIVEVKSKEPNRESQRNREEILNSGGIYDDTYALIRQSGITKTTSEAKNQILSYSAGDCFHLVCFVAIGHNAEARLEQIESTLYGKTHVADWTTENGSMKECFYFGFSDFHRYRESIDGAILINVKFESAKLCFNNHSPKYFELLQSSMASTFKEGRIDPSDLEKNGLIWMVDSDIDRRNKEAVLGFLKEKYSLGYLTKDIDMNHISTQLIVEKQKVDKESKT